MRKVVEVLQRGRLAQVDAVVDPARREEGRMQVVELPRLPGVRPEAKRREALCPAQVVEHIEIGVQVVGVVGVVRVAFSPPLGRNLQRVRRW